MNSVEQIYKEAERKLERYIGTNGLRHTQERYTILRYTCELGNPFTAGDVVKRAKADYISKATVYNTLQLLVSAQILWFMGKKGTQATYEFVNSGKVHIQLKCTRCGKVTKVRKNTAIDNVIHMYKPTNFNISHYSLYIYGACKVCRKLEMEKLNKALKSCTGPSL